MAERRTTTQQMDIISLWVEGKSRQEIATICGCSLRTVDGVKSDPELKRLYYERCSQQIENLVPLAIQRLYKLLHNDKTQATAQIAAIREVLDRSHLKELLNANENKDIRVVVSYE